VRKDDREEPPSKQKAQTPRDKLDDDLQDILASLKKKTSRKFVSFVYGLS